MADLKELSPEKLEEVVLGSLLTDLNHSKNARAASQAADVRFLRDARITGSDAKYITYAEFGTTPVTDENIKGLSVTMNGQTRYFERLAIIDQTNEQREQNKDYKDNALKAVAWLEVDKDGVPLKKEGKAQVITAFAGYEGNPLEADPALAAQLALPISFTPPPKEYAIEGKAISKKTEAMYEVGSARLYTPALGVNDFEKEISKAIEARNAANPEQKIEGQTRKTYGYSMGAAPAMASAAIKGSELVLVEPVAAPLFDRKAREAFAKPEAERTENEKAFVSAMEAQGVNAGNIAERLDDVVKNATSVRVFNDKKLDKDGKPLSSVSARLATLDDRKRAEPDRELSESAVRMDNIMHSLGKTPQLATTQDNAQIGNQFSLNVSGIIDVARTIGSRFDPEHSPANVMRAANDKLKSGFIASIHREAEKTDLNKDKQYDEAERQKFKEALGDNFASKRAAWYEAHLKGSEAAIEAVAGGKRFDVVHLGAGDLNGDGTVSATEAQRIASLFEGKSDEEKKAFADKLMAATQGTTYNYQDSTVVRAPQTAAVPAEKGAEVAKR